MRIMYFEIYMYFYVVLLLLEAKNSIFMETRFCPLKIFSGYFIFLSVRSKFNTKKYLEPILLIYIVLTFTCHFIFQYSENVVH